MERQDVEARVTGAGLATASGRAWEVARAVLGAAEVPVGTSPKELVWWKNKARLYRHVRDRPPARRTPVLLVGPLLIRRAYILDLRPGTSFVQFLLSRGFDVFLLDWLTTGDEDRHLDLDTLVSGYLLRAVRKVSRIAGERPVTMLGLSSGGVFATCLLARYPDAPVKNLVLISTPTDFSDAGYFGTAYFDTPAVDELAALEESAGGPARPEPLPGGHAKGLVRIDKLAEVFPAVPTQLAVPDPPDLEANGLSTLFSPVPRLLPRRIGAFRRLWERLGDPRFDVREWQALYRWLNEGVPFPAAAFRQWIEDFYRQNKLAKGTLELAGRRVRLGDIRCPLLNVAGLADTAAPRSSTAAIMRLAGSRDKHELVVAAGHVGTVVGRTARTEVWPAVADWLERHD